MAGLIARSRLAADSTLSWPMLTVVGDLPLQVGQIDRIEIGQMQFTNPGRGQIQRYR